MKKLLIHCKRCAVLLLALTAAFAVGCTGDLESDIEEQAGELETLESELDAIQSKIDAGDFVTGVTTNSTGGYTVTFSDGSSITIKDATIVAEEDEFYVFEVNGEYAVATKAGLIYPTSVSLAGSTAIVPEVLEEDGVYYFNIQVDSADAVVAPSNFYLIAYEENLGQTKASSLLGEETADFTPHGDTMTTVEAVSMEETDTPGLYKVGIEWALPDTSTDLIYVSAEYPVHSWDSDNEEVVRDYKYLLSATYMSFKEKYISIEEDDVMNPLTDETVKSIIVYMTEGEELELTLNDYMLTDYVLYNLEGAAIIGYDDTQVYAANGTVSITPTRSGDEVTDDETAWTSYGAYANSADGRTSTLTVKAPTIEDNDTEFVVYDAYMLYYDKNGNALVRKIQFNVFNVCNYKLNDGAATPYTNNGNNIMLALTPNSVDGTVVWNSVTGCVSIDVDHPLTFEVKDQDSFAYAGASIEFVQNEANYGYVLNDYTNYQTYLDGVATTWITGEDLADGSDLSMNIELTNTSTQPVLPGNYLCYMKVARTYTDAANDDAEFTVYSTYQHNVRVYAPQYNVEIAETVLGPNQTYYQQGHAPRVYYTENLFPTVISDVDDANDGFMEFTTYQWYDYDLARAVNVKTVDSYLPTAVADKFTFNYPIIVNGGLTSTVYTDVELALYDLYAARFDSTIATTELVGTEITWDEGLYASLNGDLTTSTTMIEVSELTTTSTDKVATVTLYQKLESGLIVPVKLVDDRKENIVQPEDEGMFVVSILINGIVGETTTNEGPTASGDYTYVDTNRNNIIDYNDELVSVGNESTAIVYINPASIERVVPTYLNLLKESYMSSRNGYPTLLSGTVSRYTDEVVLVGRDYSATTSEELSDDFISFVRLQNSSLSTNAIENNAAYYAYLYGSSYEAYAATQDDMDGIYVTITGQQTAAALVSQIGNASADLISSVDLIADVTFAVGDLMTYDTTTNTSKAIASGETGYGLTVISVVKNEDVLGQAYIYKATTNTLTTDAVYCHVVTITVTDIAGNKVTAEVPVVFEY